MTTLKKNEPRIISQRTSGGVKFTKFLTRFGTVVYFVDLADEVVMQTKDRDVALAKFTELKAVS